MGTLGGFPNPPAMGSGEQSSPTPDAIEFGTLAMGSGEQSSPTPDAIEDRAPRRWAPASSPTPDAIEFGDLTES